VNSRYGYDPSTPECGPSPGRAGGFHLFFQSRQIAFNELSQLREGLFKVLRRRVVLIDLRLRRPGRGQPL